VSTTFLARIIVKDATEVTSTPGTCGDDVDDDARVPDTEYLIDTDRRVDRDDPVRQMRCSPATRREHDDQRGQTAYRSSKCHDARRGAATVDVSRCARLTDANSLSAVGYLFEVRAPVIVYHSGCVATQLASLPTVISEF